MKKKIDTASMENELKGGSAFFKKSTEPEPPEKLAALPSPSAGSDTQQTKTVPSTTQDVSQPIDQSIDRSTNESSGQPAKQLAGKVLNRPVAFYIPESINKKIEAAIQYYQDKHHKKFDRSAVVSAILGNPNIWTDEALDQMADNVTEQLTNRLTSRLSD